MKINHVLDMSQILNPTETRLMTRAFAGLIITPNSTLNHDGANPGFDLLEISKEGMLKIEELKSGDTHEIKIESLESWSSMSTGEYLEEAVFGSALEYKKQHDWILKNTQDENQKNKMLEVLNKAYISRVGSAVQKIGTQLDNFFDQGRSKLQGFSKEEVTDIFDVNVFKSQLAEKALSAKDYVLSSETTVDIDAVKQYIRNSEKHTNSVEHMTYDDLKKVVGFIDSYNDIKSQVEGNESSGGKYYARVDEAVNTAISKLNVASNVVDALTENQQRKSEGLMRRDAFSETIGFYDSTLKAFQERLKRLMGRLAMIQSRLDGIEKDGGVDPSNKMLFSLLEFQSALSEEINSLKDEVKNVENEKRSLSENPETIVEKDSYKRIKAEYEEEKEKLSNNKRLNITNRKAVI